MSKIVENFIFEKQLGSGQFGEVFQVKNITTNEIFAAKVVNIKKFVDTPAFQEISLMKF